MESIKWKDVFNCDKVFPEDFFKCQEMAKNAGYKYMSFNTLVYDVNKGLSQNYICEEKELI